MRESRNPFRLRAAEQIESEATFLRLFEPAVLDALPADALTTPLLLLRSAPGAGKTSLFRLFNPIALQTVRANAGREEYRDLYERLRVLGAVDENRVRVVGVRLSCAHTYASLDDVGGPTGADRLLFGLLNARVLLAALRDLSAILRLNTPGALDRLTLTVDTPIGPVPSALSGHQLFDWARSLENRICTALDSFAPNAEIGGGQETLYSLQLLADARLLLDQESVGVRFVVLLDDVHLLTQRQRKRLVDELVRLRSGTTVWLAQRYESMTPVELLSLGAGEGRDVTSVYLEAYWRANAKRFESFVRNVADRRVATAGDVDISDFDACLESGIDPDQWRVVLERALSEVTARVHQIAGAGETYVAWIARTAASSQPLYERVVEWRTLEILIERDRRRDQMTFGLQLPAEELEDRDGADVRRAAELFVAREFNLPTYFGGKNIAMLASSNVDQYLALAGDLFEETVSAVLLHQRPSLGPARQDAIIRSAARARWTEIPSRAAGGRRTRDFLAAVGAYAQGQTYRPTAPYSPGITGFGYAMADHDRLLSTYPELAATIAAAIADNLLEPTPDYKCKGQLWMVLYLNRLLCAHFDLPLGYGGFKEQRLNELQRWLAGPEVLERPFL